MPEYDNRNRGSLWKNEKKTTEKHPDFTGNYTDKEGVEYWVSAWKRKPDASAKAPALSFSLNEKDAKPAARKPGEKRPADELDDDAIPF